MSNEAMEVLEHDQAGAPMVAKTKRGTSPIHKLAVSFALVLGLLFSSAAVAPAEVDAHTGGHGSCITTWNEGFWTTTTYARNDCGHTINIKIERYGLTSSKCHRVSAGSSLRWAQGFWGSNRTTGVAC